MAKHKENRTIPPLTISKTAQEITFAASSGLETEDYLCFGITPKDKRSLCIKIYKHQHTEVLIQYSRILAPIRYHYNTISFQTTNTNIVLSGANLKPLLDFMGEHRLAWIKPSSLGSPTESFMMVEGEPEIISIKIEDTSEATQTESQGSKPSGGV